MIGNIEAQDWAEAERGLDARGWAVLPRLLSPDQCNAATGMWDEESFRSRIVMARHGFGEGEYRYFDYPLPGLVAALRASLYERLAPTANRWAETLEADARFRSATPTISPAATRRGRRGRRP